MKKDNLTKTGIGKKGGHAVISILKCSFFLTAIVLGLTFGISSCATKMAFSVSPVVPAAEGSVKIKKDNNSNYKIELKMIRLAEPERLSPPKSKYVVWMVTEHDGTKNIGQLKTSSALFSKTLKSSLNTVTPFRPRNFFITAEDDADIQYPGSQVVMKTNQF